MPSKFTRVLCVVLFTVPWSIAISFAQNQAVTGPLVDLRGGSYGANYGAQLKLGLERMRFHLDLQTPIQEQGATPYSSLLDTDPLSLEIDGTTLWVAELKLGFGWNDNFRASLGISGSVPRQVAVRSEASPSIGSTATGGRVGISRWTGSELQWWRVDLSGTYFWSSMVGITAGVMWDRVSVNLSDPFPRPSTTIIPSTNLLVNNIDSITADVSARFSVYYVGIVSEVANFKGSLLLGPAGVIVDAPLRLTERGLYGLAFVPPIFLLDYDKISETSAYRFSRPGFFLEGNIEYTRNVTSSFEVSFWGQASLLQASGDGSVDLNTNNSGAIWFIFPFSSGVEASSEGSGSLRRSILSGGVSASLAF